MSGYTEAVIGDAMDGALILKQNYVAIGKMDQIADLLFVRMKAGRISDRENDLRVQIVTAIRNIGDATDELYAAIDALEECAEGIGALGLLKDLK